MKEIGWRYIKQEEKEKYTKKPKLSEYLEFGKKVNKKSINEVIQEIEKEYKKLKESKDPKEIQMLYKKILFYLNYTPIKPMMKSEVIKRLNKTLHKK